MKKCLVIPDSFKGTMTSIEVCGIMNDAILKHFPDCEVISVPIADGGEGTVDCFLEILGGEKILARTRGPFFEEIETFYGITGDTAIIEMAAAAGLSLAKSPMNPATATTFGVGQLISDAISKGCKNIILGLGGSCTNDGGAGAAAALGARFLDSDEKEFIPTGGTLSRISEIDLSALKKQMEGITVTAICDIDNPVYGPSGAAFIFAPQKGANAEMTAFLDENLQAYVNTIHQSLDIDVSRLKGGGAAGAMGAGVYAFLGAALKPGIDIVLDSIHFDELLEDCDYIITGEGKLDRQSLGGKAVIGIGRRAAKKNVPVIAVVGCAEIDLEKAREQGITAVFPSVHSELPLDILKLRCRSDLSDAMDQALAYIKRKEQKVE